MPTQRSIWCPGCERRTLHSTPSRTFSILFWFFLGFAFPPVWIAIPLLIVAPLRCQFCGRRNSILSFAPRGSGRRPTRAASDRPEVGAAGAEDGCVVAALTKIGALAIALVVLAIGLSLSRDHSATTPTPASRSAPVPVSVDPWVRAKSLSDGLIGAGMDCAMLDPSSVAVVGSKATMRCARVWRISPEATRRAEILRAASIWRSVVGSVDAEIEVVDDKGKAAAGWSTARGPWFENE